MGIDAGGYWSGVVLGVKRGIDMDGKGRERCGRDGVVEHVRFRGKRGPVGGRDAVQSLPVVKGRKVEGSMDESVGVEDVKPESEWFEVIDGAVRRGRVIRPDEMESGDTM